MKNEHIEQIITPGCHVNCHQFHFKQNAKRHMAANTCSPINWQDRQNCGCRIYVGYLMSPLSSVTCPMTSRSELDMWGSTWESCKYTMAHVLTHWQTHGQSKFGEHVKVLWGGLWFVCRTWLPRYIFHYLILLREAFFEVEMLFRPYNLFFLWGSENSIHNCIYISPPKICLLSSWIIHGMQSMPTLRWVQILASTRLYFVLYSRQQYVRWILGLINKSPINLNI